MSIFEHSSLVVFSSNKTEQTEVEKFATEIFAEDIINMFRHQQDFNVPFQRFIPMYHHHFGYQCRVQLYGCLRLIDLFEEIPHIVQIIEDKNGERIIQLTDSAIQEAVQLNLIQLIRQHDGSIPLDHLEELYSETYRFKLNHEDIGFDCLESMLESMSEKLMVNKLGCFRFELRNTLNEFGFLSFTFVFDLVCTNNEKYHGRSYY